MADDVSSVLNELIETCKDGVEGFRSAAEQAKDASLKSLFSRYSAQRAGYVSELQQLVAAGGGTPAESGHVSATIHRGWMSLKEKVSSVDDRALIEECESGEDYAMKSYRDAVTKVLPSNVQSVVQRQFSGVQEAHGIIRDLKHSGRTSVAGATAV